MVGHILKHLEGGMVVVLVHLAMLLGGDGMPTEMDGTGIVQGQKGKRILDGVTLIRYFIEHVELLMAQIRSGHRPVHGVL